MQPLHRWCLCLCGRKNVSDYKHRSGFSIQIWSLPFCAVWKLGDWQNCWSRNCRHLPTSEHWLEFISSEKLWERTQQSQIEESIKRGKWKWIRQLRIGNLGIISPVLLLSGTLRGSVEEATQSSPGGKVRKTSFPWKIPLAMNSGKENCQK